MTKMNPPPESVWRLDVGYCVSVSPESATATAPEVCVLVSQWDCILASSPGAAGCKGCFANLAFPERFPRWSNCLRIASPKNNPPGRRGSAGPRQQGLLRILAWHGVHRTESWFRWTSKGLRGARATPATPGLPARRPRPGRSLSSGRRSGPAAPSASRSGHCRSGDRPAGSPWPPSSC